MGKVQFHGNVVGVFPIDGSYSAVDEQRKKKDGKVL